MSEQEVATIDGNEATAHVAYRLNEVCAIYPITPSSAMAELADQWSSEGQENIWGNVPEVVEMQSEAGAAGTVHGALQAGALTTTFTASQGLMLIIPNMYKIAGELTCAVFHVAARSLATHALSIFGDQADVMAVRPTGFAQLASSSPQEAHDMALIAQAATMEARIPFVHFFDGFRTSHEINKVALLPDDVLRAMIDDDLVLAHRRRALNPDNPFIRGTAQNPDVYFQAREASAPFFRLAPAVVEKAMERFGVLTGRRYKLFDYFGAPDAERALVLMGSGAETARETVDYLAERGEKVGVVQVHLYRPFSVEHFLAALPSSARAVAVLDRTKEPGSTGEEPTFYAQGYFVYDSKNSGSRTVSHLRFGSRPIRSAYLIQAANFVGCHQFAFIHDIDVLANAAQGATILLNSPHGPEEVWDHLPQLAQDRILEKNLKLYVIDGNRVARETGMGARTNTIMQTCFFAISGVLPREEAIRKIKKSIEKTYSKKGEEVVRKNFEAADHTLAHLHEAEIPEQVTTGLGMREVVPAEAPEFVRDVTAIMMAGRGDELAVSALPADGTFPSGTAKWEKRGISEQVPIWDPDICIQCGNCSFVCPHSVIRSKVYHQDHLEGAPEGFKSAPIDIRGFPETRYTLQLSVEDCTGCTLCVEVCPAKSKEETGRKAINMGPKAPIGASEAENLRFFETLPVNDRSRVDFSTVRGVQFLEPLFEFSGACAGCGETPYLKLLSQLFGDRLLVANATGCSSIYGGNLPTTR